MATLIDVATPGPALAVSPSSIATTGLYGNLITMTLSATEYNLASVSLVAGTWAVVGVAAPVSGTVVLYLNTLSTAASNSWPVQQGGSFEPYITAVIKLTTTTTIYLNGTNTASGQAITSLILATRIA